MYFTHEQNNNKKSRNGDTLGPVELIVQPEQGKGPRQKRFSGFCPLRGGGYPPFPLRKKSSFLPR